MSEIRGCVLQRKQSTKAYQGAAPELRPRPKVPGSVKRSWFLKEVPAVWKHLLVKWPGRKEIQCLILPVVWVLIHRNAIVFTYNLFFEGTHAEVRVRLGVRAQRQTFWSWVSTCRATCHRQGAVEPRLPTLWPQAGFNNEGRETERKGVDDNKSPWWDLCIW